MPFFPTLESEVKAGEEPWFAGGRRLGPLSDGLRQHFQRPLYQAIIDSRAFRRLDDICFLGAIDYLFRPNGAWGARRYSRYWHTLGVAALASQGARRMGYSERDEIYAVTAALLHDIGHAPLSHSLEPVFRKHFGLDHHQACRASLYGKSEAGKAGRQLHGILHEAGLDIDLLLAVIEGGCRDRAGAMFSGPINVDTIEGIYRTYAYVASRHPAEPPPALVAAAAFGGEGRDLSVLDGFWRLKDSVYRHVIRGPRGIVADAAAQCYMETWIGDFSPGDFFIPERTLKRRHRALFAALGDIGRHAVPAALREALPDGVPFRERRFRIEPHIVPASPWEDGGRYRHSSRSCVLPLDRLCRMAHTEGGDQLWLAELRDGREDCRL